MTNGVPEAAVVEAVRVTGELSYLVRAILEAGAPAIARSVLMDVAVDFRNKAEQVGLEGDVSAHIADIILKYAEQYGQAG